MCVAREDLQELARMTCSDCCSETRQAEKSPESFELRGALLLDFNFATALSLRRSIHGLQRGGSANSGCRAPLGSEKREYASYFSLFSSLLLGLSRSKLDRGCATPAF